LRAAQSPPPNARQSAKWLDFFALLLLRQGGNRLSACLGFERHPTLALDTP
jgi:hypothetical protein